MKYTKRPETVEAHYVTDLETTGRWVAEHGGRATLTREYGAHDPVESWLKINDDLVVIENLRLVIVKIPGGGFKVISTGVFAANYVEADS